MRKFTKKDLKAGMIVETRKGWLYMVQQLANELVLIKEKYGYGTLTNYKENLLSLRENSTDYDIMKVRKPERLYQFRETHWDEAPIIWERKELPKITEVERAILENALIDGEKPLWIVRNKFGILQIIFGTEKPTKNLIGWGSDNYIQYIESYNHIFQFVKWEDDEPWYIPDLLEESED